MTKVMTFGTFDGLHKGHEYLLKEAGKYGDEVIVALAPDGVVKKLKGHDPKNSFIDRKKSLLDSGLAHRVLEGDNQLSSYQIVTDENPDIIVLGYDQKELAEDLKKVLNTITVQLITLKPFEPHKYKSSLLNV